MSSSSSRRCASPRLRRATSNRAALRSSSCRRPTASSWTAPWPRRSASQRRDSWSSLGVSGRSTAPRDGTAERLAGATGLVTLTARIDLLVSAGARFLPAEAVGELADDAGREHVGHVQDLSVHPVV